MLAMLENLFWMTASVVLFLLLIITVIYGCIEYSRQEERFGNLEKPNAEEEELCFPEPSRWQMHRALCNARKTDKLLRMRHRNCYAGYRR